MALRKSQNTQVASQSLAQTETYLGNRYYAEYDRTFGIGEVQYVLYQMPSTSSRKVVALQSRAFKTKEDEAEIEILWNSTGLVPGAEITSYNENRLDGKAATMVISEIATPTTDGDLRESDFIPAATGPGATSSGGINTDLGFRVYSPDSFFVLKITNGATAQRIHVAYTWFEIDLAEFE